MALVGWIEVCRRLVFLSIAPRLGGRRPDLGDLLGGHARTYLVDSFVKPVVGDFVIFLLFCGRLFADAVRAVLTALVPVPRHCGHVDNHQVSGLYNAV